LRKVRTIRGCLEGLTISLDDDETTSSSNDMKRDYLLRATRTKSVFRRFIQSGNVHLLHFRSHIKCRPRFQSVVGVALAQGEGLVVCSMSVGNDLWDEDAEAPLGARGGEECDTHARQTRNERNTRAKPGSKHAM
jgi:hypothetical protein